MSVDYEAQGRYEVDAYFNEDLPYDEFLEEERHFSMEDIKERNLK